MGIFVDFLKITCLSHSFVLLEARHGTRRLEKEAAKASLKQHRLGPLAAVSVSVSVSLSLSLSLSMRSREMYMCVCNEVMVKGESKV